MYKDHLLMELMRPMDSPPLTAWPTLYRSRLLSAEKIKAALRKHQLFFVRDSFLEINVDFVEFCCRELCVDVRTLISTPQDWIGFTAVKSDYSFNLTKRDWQSVLGCHSISPLEFSQMYLGTKLSCVGHLVKQRIAVIPLVTFSCEKGLDYETFGAIHKADREWRKHKELL